MTSSRLSAFAKALVSYNTIDDKQNIFTYKKLEYRSIWKAFPQAQLAKHCHHSGPKIWRGEYCSREVSDRGWWSGLTICKDVSLSMIKQVVFFHILLVLWRSNYLDPWCSLSFFISRNICSYSSLKSTTTAFTDIHRLLVPSPSPSHYNIIWSAPLLRKYFLKWNYSMTAVMPRVYKRLWLNNKPNFFLRSDRPGILCWLGSSSLY